MAEAQASDHPLAGRLPQELARHSDLLVSGGAVFIVAMLVVPLPHWALDALLVANVGLALTVLLMSTYTTHPLQFSVFPSLLLIMTLFRLAINVSATRLILLHANAGLVIAAFGGFVVGGNYVVGIVVFVILVVIQFVVITNGAGRVAEVAARFTLDAMPGKQMAIDADLNAGLMDEVEARRRREEIAREADFYGAMDGASKFVRGDAIAAVVMIVVNIVGGFIIGMAQRGMDLPTALRTYTLLTVGEGLVTQIPALIMATATGLIVTRSHSGTPLGRDLTGQLLGSPRAAWLVAATLGALALAPGLPKLPFIIIAVAAAAMATALRGTRARSTRASAQQPAAPAAPSAEQLVNLISVEPVELELGIDLIPLADPAQGGDLLERITALRKRIAEEMGLIVPPLRVRDNLALRGSGYALKLSGVRVANGEVRPGYVLAMSPTGGRVDLPGADTTDPAFGLPARWIPEGRRVDAEMQGCTVVDPAAVLLTHLEELFKRHAADLLGLDDVRMMLDHLRQSAPSLVEEVVPKLLAVTDLHRVLSGLLRERVPIRDLPRILTALAAHAGSTKAPEPLIEVARQALARTITAQHTEDDGTLWVTVLDPAVEAELAARARGEEGQLDPDWSERVVTAVKRQCERLGALGHAPVLLCSPGVRPLVRALLERRAPQAAVLSHAEIAAEAAVQSVGTVTVEDSASPAEIERGGDHT